MREDHRAATTTVGEEKKTDTMHVADHERQTNTYKMSRLARSSSSSDYETDASRDHNHAVTNSQRHHRERVLKTPTLSNMSASQMTPDMAMFFEQTHSKARSVRDDDTYDYGDRDADDVEGDDVEGEDDDNDSQRSLSYEQRRQKLAREHEARVAAVAAAKAEMDGPFMQQDDVEHYRKAVDTPLGRTAAGVAAAATLGCLLLGPVGLLVGAAAVGIGVGYMQIPEEQRRNMNNKATEAFRNAQESAVDASEMLSNSCAAGYRDSGLSDHVPVEIETFCTSMAGIDESGIPNAGDNDLSVADENESRDLEGNGNNGGPKAHDKRKGGTPTHSNWLRDKKGKVSCLRKGKLLDTAAGKTN